MFVPVIRFFDRMVQRYLPDAFIFALILTVLVFLLGVGMTDSSPVDMVTHWGDGFWDLLAFMMQMSLIVITGYMLASAPAVTLLLRRLSLFAHTPGHCSCDHRGTDCLSD